MNEQNPYRPWVPLWVQELFDKWDREAELALLETSSIPIDDVARRAAQAVVTEPEDNECMNWSERAH